MATATTAAEENNRLTKVVSTKLSIEDYNSFQITAHILRKSGLIKDATPSELLRRVVLDLDKEFRKKTEYYALRLEFGDNNIETGF